MERRDFLQFTSASIISSSLLVNSPSSANPIVDHPDEIFVQPLSDSIAKDLQNAFAQAHQLLQNDLLNRRPVIRLPEGHYYIDDIVGNNRGNYPFHLPNTFRLVGAGQEKTIIQARQPRGGQYRFLMVKPQTRLDVLVECPSLNINCVSQSTLTNGQSENIEISGVTFKDFDNAIGLQEAKNCSINDCRFIGSLVAIQLVIGDHFGNQNHVIENCFFDAVTSNGTKNNFCLRFEAPFSTVWTTTETGVPSLEECEALGGDAPNFNASAQTCGTPNDEEINRYLLTIFGQSFDMDTANRNCLVKDCEFYNSNYSAIEFAGKLNIKNEVKGCGFYNCCGTAIEFDKGASFNKVSYNLISGMKPTTAFSPAIPYIFQAAIQEQEGSLMADRGLKKLIFENGYDDPNNPNYLGEDIFYRAASLPQGNEISNNQFDVSRSYWIGQYETEPSKAAYLPDIYPSIKLRKPLDSKVLNNIEFVSNSNSEVTYDGVMGQSIVIYPDDELRDLRGGVEIRGNKFFGALFLVGTAVAPKSTRPMIIDNNDFGLNEQFPRGGISWNYCKSQEVYITNNRFKVARNGSACVMQRADVEYFEIKNNQFTLPSNITYYMRSLTANGVRSNTTLIEGNVISGGLAVMIYDWSDGYGPEKSDDNLILSNNLIEKVSGASKVVAVTLWTKNIITNNNRFESFENKTFQMYALADNFKHDENNSLLKESSSQDYAYSRNYLNTSGQYITNEYWSE
jgi:hypothetical protein